MKTTDMERETFWGDTQVREDDRLVERFTESRAQRRARLAAMVVDHDTETRIRRALGTSGPFQVAPQQEGTMTAIITCRCKYQTEIEASRYGNMGGANGLRDFRTAAEVLADRHETSGAAIRRAYAHDTTVRVLDEVREVVL